MIIDQSCALLTNKIPLITKEWGGCAAPQFCMLCQSQAYYFSPSRFSLNQGFSQGAAGGDVVPKEQDLLIQLFYATAGLLEYHLYASPLFKYSLC